MRAPKRSQPSPANCTLLQGRIAPEDRMIQGRPSSCSAYVTRTLPGSGSPRCSSHRTPPRLPQGWGHTAPRGMAATRLRCSTALARTDWLQSTNPPRWARRQSRVGWECGPQTQRGSTLPATHSRARGQTTRLCRLGTRTLQKAKPYTQQSGPNLVGSASARHEYATRQVALTIRAQKRGGAGGPGGARESSSAVATACCR
jgi:hypothetical protein